MLKYFMHKIIYFLLLQSVLFTMLNAKEPTLVLLDSVLSNGVQKFTLGNYNFYSQVYGVLTLESLYENASLNENCKKSLKTFYKKNPMLEHFSSHILKVTQMYHIDFKNAYSVLYVRGEKTLAELLLEKGLAVVKPLFNDDEFIYTYNKAQLSAKVSKKGIWQESTIIQCVNALYKEK